MCAIIKDAPSFSTNLRRWKKCKVVQKLCVEWNVENGSCSISSELQKLCVLFLVCYSDFESWYLSVTQGTDSWSSEDVTVFVGAGAEVCILPQTLCQPPLTRAQTISGAHNLPSCYVTMQRASSLNNNPQKTAQSPPNHCTEAKDTGWKVYKHSETVQIHNKPIKYTNKIWFLPHIGPTLWIK